jgi:hypothetical protein
MDDKNAVRGEARKLGEDASDGPKGSPPGDVGTWFPPV